MSAETGRDENVTLVDLLDRLCHQGVHVSGEATIGLADVELLRVAVRVLVASEDTASRTGLPTGNGGSSLQFGEPPQHPAEREPLPERYAGTSRGDASERPNLRADATPADRGSGSRGGDSTGQAGSGAEEGANTDREALARGVGQLVLTIVEVIRDLLERQSSRRVEAGTVDDDQIERLGVALEALEERVVELRELFGLEESDLNIDLGSLGRLR
jgi:hypothetical protein